jgi:uncharacterized membrane protein YjfL (UPF0719 family)
MKQFLSQEFIRFGIIILEIIVGFFWFWLGQLTYRKFFRHLNLNLELFVKDNPATAIALVGYYLGIVIALGGVLGQTNNTLLGQLLNSITYGVAVIILMLVGASIGDRFILRHCDAAREIKEERNTGAALVEAGNHIANGLILSAALAGETGSFEIGLICWLIGLGIVVLVSFVYPRVVAYNVFYEIKERNNPAAGVALAGLLIATGNIIRVALSPEFQGWLSWLQYGLNLLFCLALLLAIRWFADLILVPGVKISDEIIHQEIPNLGAGLIEAFAYLAASLLIAWTFVV